MSEIIACLLKMKRILTRPYKAISSQKTPKQKMLTIPVKVQKALAIGIDDWFQVFYDPEEEIIVYERIAKTIYE